jgi:aldehyde dehydrogenase (NAD+)
LAPPYFSVANQVQQFAGFATLRLQYFKTADTVPGLLDYTRRPSRLNLEITMLEKRSFYINGSWTAPLEGRDHPVINPSTEQADAIISLGGQKDTDAAVAAARAAFPAWMNTPSATRIKLVEKLLEQYNQRRAALAEAVSLEMGAPIDMAHSEQIAAGASHITNFLKAAKTFQFDRPLGDHAPGARVLYEPIGVCALITPWNWPMNQVSLKSCRSCDRRLYHGAKAL